MNTPSVMIIINNTKATPSPAIALASLEPGRRVAMVGLPPEPGPTMKIITSGQCTFLLVQIRKLPCSWFHKFLVIMIEGLSFEEESTKTKITNAH